MEGCFYMEAEAARCQNFPGTTLGTTSLVSPVQPAAPKGQAHDWASSGGSSEGKVACYG